MPDLPGFVHSPFADHPTIIGWALMSGNPRWVDLLDPAHPSHDPVYERAYRIRTAQHNGLDPALVTEAEFPSRMTMARNLAGAIGRQVRAGIGDGRRTVDPGVREGRLAICRDCKPYFDPARIRCRKCGCRLGGLLGKTSLATESCPIGKW